MKRPLKINKQEMLSIITFWLSKVILKISDLNIKNKFRKLERISLKIAAVKSHLMFNETCLNNNLLPKYTNIYVYMLVNI